MLPDWLKSPPTLSTSVYEVKRTLRELEELPILDENDRFVEIKIKTHQWKLILGLITTMLYVLELLKVRNIGVKILRKVLNIQLDPEENQKPSNRPKIDDLPQGENIPDDDQKNEDDGEENHNNPVAPSEDNHDESSAPQSDNSDNNSEQEHNEPSSSPEIDDKNISRPNGQNNGGRRGADFFSDAKTVEIDHSIYSVGDNCPYPDCNGKLYIFKRDGKVRTVLIFDFSSPIAPVVFKMNDLRCNLCDALFKAELPEEYKKDDSGEGSRYTYKACAAITIFHYGMGFPFYRLDQFQSFVGEKLPESTQFGIAERVANVMNFIYEKSFELAANSSLIQGDDITVRVDELKPEIRPSGKSGKLEYRSGIYSSVMVATTSEGNIIPVFKTGIKHFGEFLSEVLEKRSPEAGHLNIHGDASKVNDTFQCPTEYSRGSCWQHFRDYVVKAFKAFPDETAPILEKVKIIFKI